MSVDSLLAKVISKGWSNSDELLAVVAELVDFGNRHFLLANGVKQHQLPKPINIRRPHDTPVEKRPATKEDIAAIFGEGLRKV